MSAVIFLLLGDAALLALAVIAAFAAQKPYASRLVYGAALAISAALMIGALVQLLGGTKADELVLPLGLPWIGAAFPPRRAVGLLSRRRQSRRRAASLYGLGYGRHEKAPERVLPFFPGLSRRHEPGRARRRRLHLPAFAGSSCRSRSWALVMAHHRERDNARAGYIYLVMASFGTLALLLAFGLLAGPAAAMPSTPCAATPPAPGHRGARARAGAARRWLEGRARAAACLAAARPSGRAEPCLGADERGHDQGRGLRLHPHRLRSPRAAVLVVGHGRARARRRHRACWACSTP